MNGIRLKELVYDLQEFYLLSARGLLGIFRKPFYFNDTIEQMDYAGAGSFFIIVLVSLFVGMALSLQLSAELSVMGLKTYTGKIVGISIIRELGPMVVALVYTGTGRGRYCLRTRLDGPWPSGRHAPGLWS